MLVLTSICVMDYFSVPPIAGFEIQRNIGRLSLGSVTEVHIQLTNHSRRNLSVSMRDELPPALQQLTPIETVVFRNGASATGSTRSDPGGVGNIMWTNSSCEPAMSALWLKRNCG